MVNIGDIWMCRFTNTGGESTEDIFVFYERIAKSTYKALCLNYGEVGSIMVRDNVSIIGTTKWTKLV